MGKVIFGVVVLSVGAVVCCLMATGIRLNKQPVQSGYHFLFFFLTKQDPSSTQQTNNKNTQTQIKTHTEKQRDTERDLICISNSYRHFARNSLLIVYWVNIIEVKSEVLLYFEPAKKKFFSSLLRFFSFSAYKFQHKPLKTFICWCFSVSFSILWPDVSVVLLCLIFTLFYYRSVFFSNSSSSPISFFSSSVIFPVVFSCFQTADSSYYYNQ